MHLILMGGLFGLLLMGIRFGDVALVEILSIVLFLNDEFEGGEFVFPDLHIQVKPKPGLLVCFPSDQNYLHGVNSVKSGERYSIVSWARIKGQKTKEEEDQELLETYGVN
jgi:predicted 2-oxoglutarate/Fe(II)-dependent dioxygenase YbiX